jgi:hypothetical protein
MVTGEFMSELLQLLAKLTLIVNFAVEGNDELSISCSHRLMAAGLIDHREAAVP